MVHFTQCGFRVLFHSNIRMAESLPPGCPIREPRDQGTLAPPPGLSRPAAPFLAGRPQGIRPGPALAWPYCPFRAPKKNRRGKAFYASCLSSLPSSCQRAGAREGRAPEKKKLLETRGFEPLTSGLQSRRSSQLSHAPMESPEKRGKEENGSGRRAQLYTN